MKLMDYISFGEEITENELDILADRGDAFFISGRQNTRYISGFILGDEDCNAG